uniref:Uncharacterized protein n=1 Tax=Sinocyclocheilus rhinocerous TaxID=307959 RepID=A0A673HN99_9TELE
ETHGGLLVVHEHGEVGEMRAGAVCVCTCRCLSVNSTGLVRNTRLDSLFMEAEMMWELTARLCPPDFCLPSPRFL